MKKIDCFIYQCQKCKQMVLTDIDLDKCQRCGGKVLIIEQTKLPKTEKGREREFGRLGKRIEKIFKRIDDRFEKVFSGR